VTATSQVPQAALEHALSLRRALCYAICIGGIGWREVGFNLAPL